MTRLTISTMLLASSSVDCGQLSSHTRSSIMRSSAILAIVAGLCLMQPQLSWAKGGCGANEQCESSEDCNDCLVCVDQGRRSVCEADESAQGFGCLDEGGSEGTCDLDGICVVLPGSTEDPHMHGLLGQAIDWKGEDGAWYAILSDTADMQMSVRLTAPLPEEFPDRQLMTGVAVKYHGGHSIVIENRHPYTTEIEGCEDWFTPCLSDNALRITVDGDEWAAVPVENLDLPGQASMTAVNLPPECQPYGGDLIWAETYAKMMSSRRLVTAAPSFTEWAYTWAPITAAPTWCTKYLDEAGPDGALKYRSKHAAFRIETPAFTVRIHHGTNHQGGEVLYDGRVLPDLEFWQINLHLESYKFDATSVTGMLGETMRPVLDSTGTPIMSGSEAMRGEVEDYRISGPLATEFAFFHE